MITRNDAVRLLALCAGADQRTVGDEDVQLWLMIGQQQRWTATAAQRVIVEHYARGADRPRITPAAISDRLRALRGAAAESFRAPRIPEGLPNRDYPAWLRAQLAEHIDRALDGWSDTGVEPNRKLAVEPATISGLPELIAAAPAEHRPAIAAGLKTIKARRFRLDPERREQARAELDAARPTEAAGVTLDDLIDRDQAITVACPAPPRGCSEPVGAVCTRPTGQGQRVPVESFPAHIARLKAAGVQHAPLDPRELARAHERTPRR